MGRINLLDHATVERIAAGEVITDPAASVKELVENSLDAEASAITIELRHGGIEGISVHDDGTGIAPDDLGLAWQRHATSKLASIQDLETLRSHGFRGEALASLVACCDLVITSRATGERTGRRLAIRAGIPGEITRVAKNEGTNIEVGPLFALLPARRKFLKSPRAETARVSDLVSRLALIHPRVAFTLVADGRTLLETRWQGDERSTLLQVLGTRVAKAMVALDVSFGPVRYHGFVGRPSLDRGTSKGITVTINGRLIATRPLLGAIRSAYGTGLMKGRFPVVLLHIEVPPGALDVNVSPQKSAVRFADHEAVVQGITRALAAVVSAIKEPHRLASKEPPWPADATQDTLPEQDSGQQDLFGDALKRTAPEPSVAPRASPADPVGLGTGARPMRILGQALDTYILADRGDDLLVIDQHAAAERVLYEQLLRYLADQPQIQELLTPLDVSVSAAERTLWEAHAERFSSIGFRIEAFGPDTLRIRAIPAVFDHLSEEGQVRDLLQELDGIGETSFEDWLRHVVATRACHRAIRARDPLSRERMRHLLSELEGLDDPYHCPHGRPLMMAIDARELEKMFRRTSSGKLKEVRHH